MKIQGFNSRTGSKKEEVKKGDIIKREVIRTYSPGTLIDESFLDSRKK